ncbi:MAG TPA: hypothetical protein VFR24_13975 [Candidatus Angelobacter sp.]|nr:hypothetical protein [Candidatus Angelobacter sp.]
MSDNRQQNANELLIEGAKTYPQALAALSEFRRLVVAACEEAFTPNLSELSKYLGLPLPKNQLKQYTRPDSLGASRIDGDFGSLGVKLVEEAEQSGQYCYLLWRGGKLYGVVDIWVNNKPVSLAIFSAFQKLNPIFELKEESGDVMLMRALQPSDMPRLI